MIGKRSADNARRFMMDVAGRLVFPNAHASDAHSYMAGGYKPIVQISTDGFAAYPEAVDLAFGPYAKFGTIIKEYRNASMIYTPERNGRHQADGHTRNIGRREVRTICTSHVERLNGTQRLFMKRLNRLTYASRKSSATWNALSPCSRPTTISAGRPASRARAASFGRRPR